MYGAGSCCLFGQGHADPAFQANFQSGGRTVYRSSAFFEANIRDYEYETILDLAFEALRYADTVLINAPFTREIRDTAYIQNLRAKLGEYGAKLCVIWIVTDPLCARRA